MTKGAIYGNFKNKEALAIAAFKYNVRMLISRINLEVNKAERHTDKLFAITNYYRGYYDFSREYGGCPILNVGTDANNINPSLFRLARAASKKLEEGIRQIIVSGIETGEFRKNLDAAKLSRNIYSMIEGSVFMASTHQDRMYIINMMDLLDEMIRDKIID